MKDGTGKEYNYDSNIIFEGKFFNGKKWDGLEYDSINKIVNEFKNGKGYIKEYYDNGDLKFEEDYLNGERNGKGKEYNVIGSIIYQGEYLNGKINGKEKNMLMVY